VKSVSSDSLLQLSGRIARHPALAAPSYKCPLLSGHIICMWWPQLLWWHGQKPRRKLSRSRYGRLSHRGYPFNPHHTTNNVLWRTSGTSNERKVL